MPVGATLAAAAVTAGASLIGSSQASGAVKDASSAQTQSNADALALNKAQADRTDAEYAPWRTVGAGALQMLARTEGISIPANTFSYYGLPASGTPGAAAAGTGSGPGGVTAGGPTTAATPAPQQLTPGLSAGQAYLNANPDVKAEYDRILPTVDWNSPWAAQHGFVQGDPGAFGDWHYQNHGQAEGRAAGAAVAPTYAPVAASPVTAGPVTTAATPAPATNIGGGLLDPNGLPTGVTSSRYGDFYASPDYQFRKDEGTRTLDGNYAAKGMLDSGAFGKGLINYGQQAGSQEFGAWYNRIASLAGVGQTAVAGSAAAGAASTAAQTGILQNQGQQLSSSIATQGGINAGLINNLGATGAGLIQNLNPGNRTTPLPVQTSGGYGGNLTPLPPAAAGDGFTSGPLLFNTAG